MGCTGSKQARRHSHWSPKRFDRIRSLPFRRSAAPINTDHVVSLTSSTLGSLNLDPSISAGSDEEDSTKSADDRVGGREELAGKARAWSEMIQARIPPRTPTKTPTDVTPETINTWELMAGLEDASPFYSAVAGRSVSFHTVRSPAPASENTKSIVSDFDPDVISNFRKTLEEISPQHQLLLRSPHRSSDAGMIGAVHHRDAPKATGIVKARITAFQERIDARRACNNSASDAAKVEPFQKCPPGGEGRVVLYLTSLRGVRKTYEDCWGVKVILEGYGVKVDERDVSMHGGFRDELKGLLDGGYRLPRVFAAGAYLGGAEEVRQMHESGELGKALESCEMAMLGKGGVGGPCEGCAGVRFVPCETCSGSCKVFVEAEEEDGEEVGGGGFRRCPECNENGLVRCPLCW